MMTNKWASRIIRTRTHKKDSDDEDEALDTGGKKMPSVSGNVGMIEERGEEAPVDNENVGSKEVSKPSSNCDAPVVECVVPECPQGAHDEDEAVSLVPEDESLNNKPNEEKLDTDDDSLNDNNKHDEKLSSSMDDSKQEEDIVDPPEYNGSAGIEPPLCVPGASKEEDNKQSKKRKVKKRLVGSYSTSIKQMKDAVVRTQAMIAASKIATIQTMTTYGTERQAMNNPKSDTILLNYDEIVERPDKKSEGERARVIPKWTILVPVGTKEKDMGIELEKLGKAMQEEKKRGKKSNKAIKAEKKEFEYEVVTSCEKYLASIYGKEVQGPLLKKAKTTDA
jgi:hypothetical protein